MCFTTAARRIRIVWTMSATSVQAWAVQKSTILRQVWTSDNHDTTKGMRGKVQDLRFATVVDIRQPWRKGCAASFKKFSFLPPFWVSDDHETTRRQSPPLACEPSADRKNNVLKRRWPFEEQPSSAAFIFRSLQEQLSLAISKEQLSSAAFQEQLSWAAFQ